MLGRDNNDSLIKMLTSTAITCAHKLLRVCIAAL